MSEAERTGQGSYHTAEPLVARSMKGARRRAIDVSRTSLVTLEPLIEGERLPLVARPGVPGVDLVAWARDNREVIEANLHRHGAILFRGFDLAEVAQFEAFAEALCPTLFGEYNDLPHEAGRVYGTTPYPADKAILFHNESSHMHRFNLRQFFFCVQPSPEGGRTPIFDCRDVLAMLPPAIVEAFEKKGLLYVRNFSEGVDVSWQRFFHTDDRAKVEAFCRDAGTEFTWKPDGGLRTWQRCPGVARHPRTGEKVFFNQVQLHHPRCLDPEVRASLLAIFGPDDLPRNVLYGDGTPIPDEVIDTITEVYWKAAKSFDWEPRDLVAIDNMLVSHARLPYSGPRKILVAMGDIVRLEDLPPV